ncbi:molybdate ABC transporter substrate-binding protein [Actinomadura rugatobispora]|uniref:Molybdate ABC transporter substrate-binding protein n=1 Tax=Actinomadura rugatobispora TaxID=1994 RepID=A0ABW0ZU09_9ACTN|nr:molybdate ABC transporter substrate-binding protein [Actinomadura rugatobispora]
MQFKHLTTRLTSGLTAGVAGLALLATAVTGCGDTGDDASGGSAGSGKTVTVFAAASLTESFTALGKTFEGSHPGVKVRFNFGGSSTLAQQITQGAPVDVFAAASPATMKTVTDARLAEGQPQTFVRNRLQIATPADNPGKIAGIKDLAGSDVKVVLCAQQVPCGAAAQKALGAAGVKVEPVSLEQDVKGALNKVTLGEADAALVYRSDVKAAGAKVHGIDFPEAAQAINDYPIATLAKAPQPALAKEFLQLVVSAQGRTVLTAAGFESP